MRSELVMVLMVLVLAVLIVSVLATEQLVYQDEHVLVYERVSARVVIPGFVLGTPVGGVAQTPLVMRRLRMVVLQGDILTQGYAFVGKINGAGAILEIKKDDTAGALMIAIPSSFRDAAERILGFIGAGDTPDETRTVSGYYVLAFYGTSEN